MDNDRRARFTEGEVMLHRLPDSTLEREERVKEVIDALEEGRDPSDGGV